MVGRPSNMPSRNSHRMTSSNGSISSDTKQFLQSHDHIVTYLLSILEDIYNMNPLYGKTDYLRDAETLSRRYSHEGLSFATKTLPALFDSLLNYLETGNSAYPCFRLAKGEKYPVFLRQLFRPIYELPTSEQAGLCVKFLYQLCVAFKKLKGPYKQGVLVKQLDEFCSVDQSLEHDWSESDILILEKARNLIRQIVEDLDPFDPDQAEDFIPRPGPGATNTPTEKHERYRPHVLYTQLMDAFHYDEWYSSLPINYNGSKATILSGCATQDAAKQEQKLKISDLLASRFKFVHKTYGKPRCICIEQLEMQWLQQGLRRALYDRIEHHPLSRGFVSFTDQSINGLLALQASGGYHLLSGPSLRRLATIDMSAASDRISRQLVEYLFQDNPALLKALLVLSTRVIELPKDVPYHRKFLFAKKFAPMGSALCFPVMGLVHYALVKSIISTVAPQHINDIPVWVYGDDIIIDCAYADNVFASMPRFGMKLNQDKSFVKSLFRESCGVHAYNGINVTPVRFKTIVRNPLCVSDLVSALQNEYALYSKGYLLTAKFIRQELLRVPRLGAKSFPIVGPESPVLGWIRNQGDAAASRSYQFLKRRWSSDLQRFHYKARVIVDLYDNCPPISESEYYLRKQVLNTLDARKIGGLPLGLSTRWQWLPDSAFYRN